MPIRFHDKVSGRERNCPSEMGTWRAVHQELGLRDVNHETARLHGENAAPRAVRVTQPDSHDSFICRSCYALGHNYIYPSKQLNDMTHLAWCRQELAAGGPERLGKALALAIQHIDMYRQAGFQPFFRIHDAGDFESPEYLEAWVICCALMKHMRFWAPSRQWIFKKWADLYRSAEKRVRDAGGWLVIRPSALRACEPAPAISGLTAGSGVGANTSEPCIWVCPVYNQIVMKLQPDGTVKAEEAVSCLEAQCTLCWDINTTVSYGLH
jgi:hypothetical protein